MDNLDFEALLKFEKHTAPKGIWMIEGYAATSDLDSQNDIINQDALVMGAESLKAYTTVLFNHDPDKPIGQVVESKALEGHLFVKVALSKTEPDIWAKVQDGTISKFSIRGRITDSAYIKDPITQKEILVIKGMKLHEISLVSVPANVHAKTLGWYIEKAIRENIDSNDDVEKKTYRKPGESMSDCVSRKTKLNMAEGMPHEQAVAAAYSMCGENKKNGECDCQEKVDKGIIMGIIDAIKSVVKSEIKEDENLDKEDVKKSDEKVDETKEQKATEVKEEKVEKTETKEDTKVTLDVGALATVISQLQTIAKDVTTQSEAVKKSMDEVAKAKEDIVKMIGDLNSVVKEIPLRGAQHASTDEKKEEDRKKDTTETPFESATKTDAYKNAKPADKLFMLFEQVQKGLK